MADYIHKFETSADCTTYESGADFVKPYVSYTEETEKVRYNKDHDEDEEEITEPTL